MYIYLAFGSGALGAVITFVLVVMCRKYNVDLYQHLWLLAIPLASAVIINILLIEIYDRLKRR